MKNTRSISSSTSPTRTRASSSDDNHQSENTPLLAQETTSIEEPPKLHHGRSAFFVWSIIGIVIILLTMTNGLIQAPQQRILESIFCKQYYQLHDPSKLNLDGEVDEIWCKIPAVGKPLATIRGSMDALEAIPGVLLPVPFGILADRIGRKLILLLSVTGITLTFLALSLVLYLHNILPIKLILIAPLCQMFGGGAAVAISTAFTMVADSVPAKERAVVYYRLSGGAMIGPLIAYPVAAFLMTFSPYLSIMVALCFSVVATLLVLLLPETLNVAEVKKHRAAAAAERAHLPRRTLPEKIRAGWVHLSTSTRDLLHHKAVLWLLPLFLVTATLTIVMDLVIQFASEKYLVSIRDASMLAETHVLAHAVMLIFILPAFSHYLTNTRHMDSARKDLFIIRVSAIVGVFGLLLIGFSPSMLYLVLAILLFSLMSGFIPSTRSLLVGLVRPEQNARLFAVAGTLTYAGSAFSSPLIARTFGWALERGGALMGMPFYLTAFLLALVSIPLFTLRFQGDQQDTLAITIADTEEPLDNSDSVTLVSQEAEEERERERLGTKLVEV